MAALEEWTTAASERMVLELAREVAHHVVRPAPPVTT